MIRLLIALAPRRFASLLLAVGLVAVVLPSFAGDAAYRVISTPDAPLSAPAALAVSADGRLIAVGTLEGDVQIWDWRQAKLIHTRRIRDEIIHSLFFIDSDGRVAISYARDDVYAHLFVWELRTGYVADVGEIEGRGVGSMLPDGSIGYEHGDGFAFTDRFGADSSRYVEFEESLDFAALSPDGRLIAGGAPHSPRLVLLDNQGKLLRSLLPGFLVRGTLFSPDNRIVAVMQQEDGGLSDPSRFNRDTNGYDLFDVATGNRLYRVRGHDRFLSGALFSPDGARFLTWSGDNTLILWDVETGEMIRRFRGHRDIVTGARFLGGGSLVASASLDGSTRIWAADSGREIVSLHTPAEQSTPPGFLAISPDGHFVEEGSARLSIVRVAADGADAALLSARERADLRLGSMQIGGSEP